MIRVQKTRDIERMRILAGLEDSREANGLLKESIIPTNSILGESTDSDLEDMDEESGDDLEECGDSLGSDMIDEEGYVDDEDDFDTSFEDSVVSRASRDKKARRAAEKDDFVDDDDDDDDSGFVDPEDMDDDEVPGDTKMGKASGSDVYNKLQHSDTIEIYADDDQLNKFTLNGNPRRIAYLNQQLRQAQKKANYEETKVYLCFDRGTYKPKFFKPRDERDLVAVITPDGSESYD